MSRALSCPTCASRPVPPIDGDAEVALLAGALMGLVSRAQAARLPPEHLSDARNVAAWRHVRVLLDAGVTTSLSTVVGGIKAGGELGPAVADWLYSVHTSTPVSLPIDPLIDRVLRAARLRKLLGQLDAIRARVCVEETDDATVYALLSQAARAFRG